MRRVVAIVVAGYLLVALGNKLVERMGGIRCGCAEDCWCRRPGLSLFRWVFPRWHRTTHTPEEKAQFHHSTS